MRILITALSFVLFAGYAQALTINDLSRAELSAGLKQALTQGVDKAVAELGAADGFFGNYAVKIPLPEALKKAERTLRMLGMGSQADDLVLKMNRAAEAAVPEARLLLVDAVKKMSVADAKAILAGGGDDAATQYFKKTTSVALAEKLLPIVKTATANVQLAQQYNKFAQMGNKFGLVKAEQVNLEQYITQKTLDGVYLMIAKEEAAIRHDPVGQTSRLLQKVFAVAAQ
jgi:hypothetical protein